MSIGEFILGALAAYFLPILFLYFLLPKQASETEKWFYKIMFIILILIIATALVVLLALLFLYVPNF
tara:strand:+ start:93 stop:293 length:201 start_codon:yes stop_codon:yes gene_type:complete